MGAKGINRGVRCTFRWRPEPYDDPDKSFTGELYLEVVEPSLWFHFSFDVILMYSIDMVLGISSSGEEFERFIDRIHIRRWIGESYALPYDKIVLPFNNDRHSAQSELLHGLIIEFVRHFADLRHPDDKEREEVVAFSFPTRELSIDVMLDMVYDTKPL